MRRFLGTVEQPTPWHINCGLCEEFAEEVEARLKDRSNGELAVIWLHETLIHDDEGPTAFDPVILDSFGIALPDGREEGDVFEIVSQTAHAVLVYQSEQYGVRFYDAQAVQGVRSYFDLPLMEDAVGMLDDPEVAKWIEVSGEGGQERLEMAVSDYFQRQMTRRTEQHRNANSYRQTKELERDSVECTY